MLESGEPKAARYRAAAGEIEAVVAGERDTVARMASVAAVLHQAFDHFLWTGFYRVDEGDPAGLVVGPYQGSLGCLRIAFGQGVCGAAAAGRRTVIVADVHDFPGHIACDARSRSEIVAPVFDARGELIAVLDIDCASVGAFDAADAEGLNDIVRRVFAA